MILNTILIQPRQKQVTINKAIQCFRRPIEMAVVERYSLPQHKPVRVLKEVMFSFYGRNG
jgi:hypothetical protein